MQKNSAAILWNAGHCCAGLISKPPAKKSGPAIQQADCHTLMP